MAEAALASSLSRISLGSSSSASPPSSLSCRRASSLCGTRISCINKPIPGLFCVSNRISAVPNICAAAATAEDREALTAFVKASMPGGIAAQKLLATGRRKTAVARVCLLEGTGKIIINCRTAQDYLQGNPLWLQYVKYPLTSLGYETKYDVIVKAEGGGLSGQAQAILLGISRALCIANPANRDPLKKLGLLTRDPRAVERKKAGLHKARKAPQYSKR
ncbi:hypothetical protein KP509_15G045500 [Ceratopteris richardii]|uniref:Small ribosomal subunit protein uS9c n=1 Tax=Ceratopteris richardii TaxID=49495 RepID=A0A8T2T6M5_CERRI|nr:hypothetical protein KP509_15G045500 [Ceratopteris richardii]